MEKNGKKMTANEICSIALFMALVCVSTLFFKIPIPLGYAHLGNGFIFLAAIFLGNPGGMLCAGIGSALADMLGGWYAWILPTLVIKCLMGFFVSAIACDKEGNAKIFCGKTYLALAVGTVEMVLGYFIAGALLEGNLAAGAAQIPGLLGEDILGIILFFVLGVALEKAGVKRLMRGKA
ncbi:MAG: ECF transporter S component [Lachnospiraceae bacterium]|nr:ECF transporter S component [Lachnospiraceae bacterium]